MRFLRNQENKICQDAGKLSLPPDHRGGEMSLSDLGRYAGKAGKKAAEMGRFFASEWLREPGAQQMLVNKAAPLLKSGIDQLSTVIRPKRQYKTNRKDLDGAGVDVHSLIMKLPKPKKGFTLPGHNFTGPGNPLEKQVRFDEKGKILEIMQQPTGKTDAVAMQHDVDYSVCEKQSNPRKCKNKVDRKMVAALDAIPWKERQWGHALARNTINVKQKLGLGAPKNGKRF